MSPKPASWASPGASPARSRDRWWRAPSLAAAAVLLVLVLGVTAVVLSDGGAPGGGSGRRGTGATPGGPVGGVGGVGGVGAPTRLLASGTDYEPARFAAQIRAVLDSRDTGRRPAPVPAGCLQALSLQPGRWPTLVDRARFRGLPAVIVAEPGPGGSLSVYAVSPACSAADQHVLDYVTLPPPT